MTCLPVNQIIKSIFGSGQKANESSDEAEQSAAPLEISSPQDFRKEKVSFPSLTADEIAHLREQAIASTLRTTTPPPRDSYSSRSHGRNGSYASTFGSISPTSTRDRMRNGSVSSHPTFGGQHARNGSLASSQHSAYWGGPGSPQRTRHASVY